jgi:L-alanine-DL-glutamate epimerase-like enolase superfamily enzyme
MSLREFITYNPWQKGFSLLFAILIWFTVRQSVESNGGDPVVPDPEYDLGITGAMKCAHIAEGLGIDVQVHAPGPAHRACVAAIRNTHMYELALVGPGMPNLIPPVYACGYSDQLDCVDKDGMVTVPTGPGLGVTYDWDFINANRQALHAFE